MLDKKIIKILSDFFADKPEIILVMLYGSYAEGRQTQRSDVDISVAKSTPLSFDEKLSMQAELSCIVQKEVDLVDIRAAEGVLHYSIFTDGLCLKKTENTGEALLHKNIMTALFWYEDFYPIYKRGQDIILKHSFEKDNYAVK